MADEQQATKDEVRQRVWRLLNDRGAGVGEVAGSIPNFVGSEQAADRLRLLPAWQAVRTIQANPDWHSSRHAARRYSAASWCSWPCRGWPSPSPSTGSPDCSRRGRRPGV